MRKRGSPGLAEAESDLAVFLKLLQIAHSLFQEVDELKATIAQIGESIGANETGSMKN